MFRFFHKSSSNYNSLLFLFSKQIKLKALFSLCNLTNGENKKNSVFHLVNCTYGKSISTPNDLFGVYRIWFLHFFFSLLPSLYFKLVFPVAFLFHIFIDSL